MNHRVAQVGACGLGGKYLKVQAECLPEVVANVLYHLLLGRGREARYGDRLRTPLVLLILADELADIEIVHAEVLTPRGEAVRLVNHDAHDVAYHQYALYRLGPQHLGSDVQQRRVAVHHPLDGLRAADGVKQSVDGDGVRDAPFGKVVHLVFHQRLQGRDDHRQAMQRPSFHQRRELECQRFAAARREDGQKRFMLHGRTGRILLQRFAIVGAEFIEAEVALQIDVHVEGILAVSAPFAAAGLPEKPHHVLHIRIVMQHPCRSD